jgi:g-D-glutamyl-meso-diaminopimelate peptidase
MNNILPMKYESLLEKLKNLGTVSFIGKTKLGYDIPLVHIGSGKAKVLVVASVHAREHITTTLLNELIGTYDKKVALDYIPVLNIDGVMLATNGLSVVKDDGLKEKLVKLNCGSTDFSLWKANINGVDINVNFDADWGKGAQNITYPYSENYIGAEPESEIETKVMAKVLENDYKLVAAYHSKGEVVYWGFGNNFSHYEYAKKYADFVGYELTKSEGSAGGLKDYYALKYKGLGITVEVGEDRFSHPYPLSELDNLIKKHTGSIELLAQMGEEIEKLHGDGFNRSETCF